MLDAAMPGVRSFRDADGRRFICRPDRRTAGAKLFALWPGHLESHAAINFDLGLRWDVNPALNGKNLANDPFTVTGLNDPGDDRLGAARHAALQTTYGNVAPRFGLAYHSWDQIGPPFFAVALGSFTTLGQVRSEERPDFPYSA